jgi:ribosome maturation factor RimP
VPWAELGNGRVQVEFGRPGADDLPGDDLTDDEPTDDEPTDDDLPGDTAFADDDIEPGGIPQARGGAQ